MIAVIVPVYNAEKYIERCIESIIKQTYKEWELFLIDDGSTDNSPQIIDKYVESDPRIHAIHQQNSGAGAARNVGIELAKGQYVVFIDSDDYIAESYFQLLSKHTEDVVFINVNRRNEHGVITAKEKMSVLQGKSKDDIIRGQMTGKILWGGVRKAVKTNLLKKNNIKYSNSVVGEEASYSFLLLYYAETIGFIDEDVYTYEVHEDSLSQTILIDPLKEVVSDMKNITKNLGCYELYANTINALSLTATIISLSRLANKYESFHDYKKKAKERIKYWERNFDIRFSIDKKHLAFKARVLEPFIKMKMLFFIFIVSKIYY